MPAALPCHSLDAVKKQLPWATERQVIVYVMIEFAVLGSAGSRPPCGAVVLRLCKQIILGACFARTRVNQHVHQFSLLEEQVHGACAVFQV